jgi:uncharacterized protein (TIGR00369 family)
MSTPADVTAFFAAHFPHALDFGFAVDALPAGGAVLSLQVRPDHLRPGDTVSGPTLMTLADTAMYVALIASEGPDRGGRAVTSSLEAHFLRRPRAAPLTARCRLLKVGRRLAVGAVELTVGDDPDPVAFCTVTYGFPEP